MITSPEGQKLKSMLRLSWSGWVVVFVFSFFINILILVSPIYMQQVFDRVLMTHHTETLFYLTLFAMFALLLLGLLDALRGYALSRIGRWWDDVLRRDVTYAALTQSRFTGRIAGSAMQDLSMIRGFVGSPGVVPFFDAPWMLPFIALLWMLHPWLGITALLSALALFALAFVNEVMVSRALKGVTDRQNRYGAFAATSMRHADTVHAMGMYDEVHAIIRRDGVPVADASAKAADISAMIGGITKFLRFAVQILIMALGAWLVLKQELSSGGMIASSIILGRALAPVEQALGAWRQFVAAREAQERLTKLLTALPAEAEPIALPAPRGYLTLEDVGLQMPTHDRPVLRDVSMKVEPGQAVALVGPSGSGKSTLCKLITGTWKPSKGVVRIDGADVHQWNRAQLGPAIGYLPQSIELFPGTVRMNIARLTDGEDSKVVQAAQLAGCHEMILRLPKGYDTEIGEAGNYLSGGQLQRVALARALYGEPRILVLDEPNSNLDSEGELALVKAIQFLKERGATIIIVSHRLSLLGPVDLIAVIRDGTLDRMGPRDQVLRELAPQAQVARPANPGAQPGLPPGQQPARPAAGGAPGGALPAGATGTGRPPAAGGPAAPPAQPASRPAAATAAATAAAAVVAAAPTETPAAAVAPAAAAAPAAAVSPAPAAASAAAPVRATAPGYVTAAAEPADAGGAALATATPKTA